MYKNINLYTDNAEHCVCCGQVIPEGRQVCSKCEYKFINNRNLDALDDIDEDDDYTDWDDEIYDD